MAVILLSQATLLPAVPANAQSRSQGKAVIRVSLKDKQGTDLVLQQFGLLVQKVEPDSAGIVSSSVAVQTLSDGSASLTLPPGEYLVTSKHPFVINDMAYDWSVKFKVELGMPITAELNDDNAEISPAAVALNNGRITEESDLLGILGDSVVNVQGEFGHATGVILDQSGLILTNREIIGSSKEIAAQFGPDRKVTAKLLADDVDKDLAVVWTNPAACNHCRVLEVANAETGSPPIVNGARLFAVSSPFGYEKKIATTNIERVEPRTLMLDVKIDVNNGGAPLFNPRGEIVGLLRFGDDGVTRAGVSRAIRIEEARLLLAQAREALKNLAVSSEVDPRPTEPTGFYPAEALKAQVEVEKKFNEKPYRVEIGKYEVTIITPVFKHYIIEKNRFEMARQRPREERGKPLPQYNTFRSLRNWADYVNQQKPVVHVLAIPEIKATGKSTFLQLLGAGLGAMGGMLLLPPRDFKFSTNFNEMTLNCDGKPVTPIQRGRIPYRAYLESYTKLKERFAFAGLYTYSMDTFEPGKCKQLTLQLISDETPVTSASKPLNLVTTNRVWDDFAAYRQLSPTKP
jgi:S1-C subfamily serine protease